MKLNMLNTKTLIYIFYIINVLLYLNSFNISKSFAIDVTNTTDESIEIIKELNEHQKYTIPFINEGINTWKQVLTYRKISLKKRIELYKKLLISPTFLKNKTKLDKSISRITNFNSNKFLIFDEESTHKIQVTVPVMYKRNINTSIMLYFLRKKTGKNIYKWFLSKVSFQNNVSLKSKNQFIGLDEVEVAKKFSHFLDRIRTEPIENISQTLSRIISVDSSIKILSDLLSKKTIAFYEQSYNVSITYQVLNIPYGESINEIEGFKYIIYNLYRDMLPTKQIGWLIENEGEMFEYYMIYFPNSPEGFYSKKLFHTENISDKK